MTTNRESAVIMFSDVVGYTAMMGKDETSTLKKVQEAHHIQKALIKEFQGNFVKEIGDGLMAYFESPDKAIQCCIDIQKSISQKEDLQIRIGLHRAKILIENDDIFGDGVNIASRIEPLADPGGIYVSSQVIESMAEDTGIDKVLMGNAKLKNVKDKIEIYAIQGEGLTIPSKSRFQKLTNPRRKLALVPSITIFLIILAGVSLLTINFFNKKALIEETRNSIDEIEELVQSSWRDYSKAYDLAMEAAKIIPNDTRVQRLIKRSSMKINVNTEPEGAQVFIKKYDQPDAPWEEVGITPIDSLQLPISVFKWRIEKEGYETVLAAATTFDWKDFTDMRKDNLFIPNHFFRTLDKIGSIPSGMIRVNGAQMPYGTISDFLIDKYEVTNGEFKEFVDAGGYTNQEFWKEEFIRDNKKISWDEIRSLFVDKTGQPGPATWEDGEYAPGTDYYPVSGVSWYEAKAYAAFAGKELPSGDHWGLARGENTFIIRWPQMGGYAIFAPFSNFNHQGPVEVGSLNGITPYGAYDMAGNVNEWCINDAQVGKLFRGGGWNSNSYMFSNLMHAPAFDRSETMGFRCVKYLDDNPLPPNVHRRTLGTENIFAAQEVIEPVSDEIFNVYKAFYEYDRTALNSSIIHTSDDNPDWVHEKVIFDAAYNDEKVIVHVFLPKKAKPPFQPIIYGPGSASFFQLNSDSIESYYEFPVFLQYLVENGRAVIYPVVKGTFERRDDKIAFVHLGSETQQYTDFITQVIKDYRRTIDYLETRGDIDSDKIAFYGMSWGPMIGSILTSIDNRIRTNIFISGGIKNIGRPEVNPINFFTRVKLPTLMVNGRYDSVFPLETSILPLFNGIAVADDKKKLVLHDTDHIPLREGMVTEVLSWLDQQLGQIEVTGASP